MTPPASIAARPPTRTVHRVLLTEEPEDDRPVGELDRPDHERRRDPGHERAEARRVELPHLELDRRSARRLPHHPRARRRGAEVEEPVDRRGRGRRHEACAQVEQLVVERLAREVRADDRQSGAARDGEPFLAHHPCREGQCDVLAARRRNQ